MAVSDIVVRRELPDDVKRSMELWSGCIAGDLRKSEHVIKLQALDGAVMSAFIRAKKPYRS
jgi:hypothetical protein